MKRLLGLLTAVALGAGNPVAGQLDLSLPQIGDPADQAMSAAEESRMGRAVMRQLRQNVDLVEDPAIAGYIQDLGARLASHAGPEIAARNITTFVVDSPRINAFALPGGYIGINTGLIDAARSESELGGVIAHEIAHVTQRHIARRMLDSEGTGMRTVALVLAGILIGSQNPQAGAAATIGGLAGGIESQLAYSREYEREADRIGMRTLAAASLDPRGMPRFFDRLLEENRYRQEALPFLSTHPLTTARIADAMSRAGDNRPDDVFESPSFPLIQARIRVAASDSAEHALLRFRDAVEAAPEHNASRYGLALALKRSGDPDAAASQLHALLEDEGEHAIYFLTLAEIAMGGNDTAEALDQLDTGLSLFPGDFALRVQQVDSLLAAGRTRDALRRSSDLTSRWPENVTLHRLRARAASEAGNSAEAALAMAEYYAVQGDLRGALSQVARVLDDPTSTHYQRSRAEALQQDWQSDLARRDG